VHAANDQFLNSIKNFVMTLSAIFSAAIGVHGLLGVGGTDVPSMPVAATTGEVLLDKMELHFLVA
jgi:hypothetical protein